MSIFAAEIASVIESIEADDGFERGATRVVANENGEVVSYDADRENFPAQPEERRCGWCPYKASVRFSLVTKGNVQPEAPVQAAAWKS